MSFSKIRSHFQHFRFTHEEPGVVYVKSSGCGAEKRITLLKDTLWQPSPSDLPSVIVPNGLSLERQWYLYTKIREFCPEAVKDLVCPKPAHEL